MSKQSTTKKANTGEENISEELKGQHIDITDTDSRENGSGMSLDNSDEPSDGGVHETKPADSLEELEKENELLKQEIDFKNDQLLRKAAEFENMRKRVQKERIQLFETAQIEAISEFLQINDDLKRTLDASTEVAINENFLKGVQMVSAKFDSVLEKYRVIRIDEVEVPFNVDYHEALMKQPTQKKETESNMVLQILEPGYRLGDRIIRHAKVIVSE